MTEYSSAGGWGKPLLIVDRVPFLRALRTEPGKRHLREGEALSRSSGFASPVKFPASWAKPEFFRNNPTFRRRTAFPPSCALASHNGRKIYREDQTRFPPSSTCSRKPSSLRLTFPPTIFGPYACVPHLNPLASS